MQTLNCSHLFSSAVPLLNIPLDTYFQVLFQAALTVFLKGKTSTHIIKVIKSKQALLKSCYLRIHEDKIYCIMAYIISFDVWCAISELTPDTSIL